jgi:hypothetical protein
MENHKPDHLSQFMRARLLALSKRDAARKLTAQHE